MKLQELFEAAVAGKPLKIDQISVEKAIGLLNKYCKDALWMLERNAPIWRGQSAPSSDFAVVDPKKSERRSENTANFYTELLDYNPYNTKIGLPKRRFSIICSTSSSTAADFSPTGDPLAVIPFDAVKIGCTGHSDLWSTRIQIFDMSLLIEDWNGVFSQFMDHDTIEEFMSVSKRLAAGDAKLLNKVKDAFELDGDGFDEELTTDFLGYLFKCYSPEQTKFKVATSATIQTGGDQEVWVGGKCMLIKHEVWEQMVKAFKRQSRQLAAAAK